MPAKLIMFMVLHKYQLSVNSPLICRSIVSVPISFQEIQQHGNFLLLKSQTLERGWINDTVILKTRSVNENACVPGEGYPCSLVPGPFLGQEGVPQSGPRTGVPHYPCPPDRIRTGVSPGWDQDKGIPSPWPLPPLWPLPPPPDRIRNWQDTMRAVRLLRSRRRTFLYLHYYLLTGFLFL